MSSNPMTDDRQPIALVREGMTVRDARGKEIGTVREVYAGTGDFADPGDELGQARAAIANVQAAISEPDRPLAVGDSAAVGVGGLSGDGGRPFAPLADAAGLPRADRDEVLTDTPLTARSGGGARPDPRQDRLMQRGYIRINSSGLFTGDRLATADQIARVGDDDVQLAVERDALMSAS